MMKMLLMVNGLVVWYCNAQPAGSQVSHDAGPIKVNNHDLLKNIPYEGVTAA
jgi:hypothetical protein